MNQNVFISADFAKKFIDLVNDCELLAPLRAISNRWDDVYDDAEARERYGFKLFHREGGTFAEISYNGRSKVHKLNRDIYAGNGWVDIVSKYLPRGREVMAFGLAVSGKDILNLSVFGTSAKSHALYFDGETMSKGNADAFAVSALCAELRKCFTASELRQVR